MNKKKLFPLIIQELCQGCEVCIQACPEKAIKKPFDSTCAKCIKYCISMEVPCQPDIPVICLEECNACGICEEVCPHHAIRMQIEKRTEE